VSDANTPRGLARSDVVREGLAGVDLFSSLTRRDLTRIARSGRVVDHRPNKEVVAEGRQGIAFHLIVASDLIPPRIAALPRAAASG